MKKKTLWIVAALVLAAALIAFGLFRASYHTITVVSGESNVERCPHFARAGQEVTVLTMVVCDGEVYVNGVDGAFQSPGVFVFTMPDEDVELKVTVVANPNGA